MKGDFHIHTYYSDGVFSPEKIVDLALDAGLQAIALTDHDNVLSYDVAVKYLKNKEVDFKIIQGIEVNTLYKDYEVQKIDLDIIYVDGVNGSNSNIGSIDEPVQTLIYALSNINDNATIIMLNDYNSEIDKMYWFTIVKNVIIKGYGSEKINIEFEHLKATVTMVNCNVEMKIITCDSCGGTTKVYNGRNTVCDYCGGKLNI